MRYSFLTLFTAITIFAVGCSKDDDKKSFSSIEGGWFAQRSLNGNYAQQRHSIFLKSGSQAVVYYFASATEKYKFDGTYNQTGDTITITYFEHIRTSTNPVVWTPADITIKMGVNPENSYMEGRWFGTNGGNQTKFGVIYANRDEEIEESMITGSFMTPPAP